MKFVFVTGLNILNLEENLHLKKATPAETVNKIIWSEKNKQKKHPVNFNK